MEAAECLLQQCLRIDRNETSSKIKKSLDENFDVWGEKPYPWHGQKWLDKQDVYARRWFSNKQSSALCSNLKVHVSSIHDLEEVAKNSLVVFKKHLNDSLPINIRIGNFKFTEREEEVKVEVEVRWAKCSFISERCCELKQDGQNASRVKFISAIALIEGLKELPCFQQYASRVIDEETGQFKASVLHRKEFSKLLRRND